MMKNNSTFEKPSAHIFHQLRASSLAQALDLCRGPQIISAGTQFFYKPESNSCEIIHWGLHPIQSFFEWGRLWNTRQLN